MADYKEILSDAEERMEEAVMYLEDALSHIRAGKANVKLLDGIRVDNYGSMVPINQCAAVTTEGEQAKVSVRNARRDGNEQLKRAVKDGLSEDFQKDGEAELQKKHDKFIKQIDDLLAAKEKEIMTV